MNNTKLARNEITKLLIRVTSELYRMCRLPEIQIISLHVQSRPKWGR